MNDYQPKHAVANEAAPTLRQRAEIIREQAIQIVLDLDFADAMERLHNESRVDV